MSGTADAPASMSKNGTGFVILSFLDEARAGVLHLTSFFLLIFGFSGLRKEGDLEPGDSGIRLLGGILKDLILLLEIKSVSNSESESASLICKQGH